MHTNAGRGRLDLLGAHSLLPTYVAKPRATLTPPALDFSDCPAMWPYCAQVVMALFSLSVSSRC